MSSHLITGYYVFLTPENKAAVIQNALQHTGTHDLAALGAERRDQYVLAIMRIKLPVNKFNAFINALTNGDMAAAIFAQRIDPVASHASYLDLSLEHAPNDLAAVTPPDIRRRHNKTCFTRVMLDRGQVFNSNLHYKTEYTHEMFHEPQNSSHKVHFDERLHEMPEPVEYTLEMDTDGECFSPHYHYKLEYTMALKNQNILFDVRLHNHEDWDKANSATQSEESSH
jgi:hypothetical protein